MSKISRQVVDKFGQYTWREFGFDDSNGKVVVGFEPHGKTTFVMRDQWKHVAESQLRLSYKKNKVNLIDLINKKDYEKSFNSADTSSYYKDTKNPELM
jgi:hypothetical protein